MTKPQTQFFKLNNLDDQCKRSTLDFIKLLIKDPKPTYYDFLSVDALITVHT